jgi:hypothetical protein
MTGTRTRKGNRESWIRETPNARGYYEARVWMGTKPDGRPDHSWQADSGTRRRWPILRLASSPVRISP